MAEKKFLDQHGLAILANNINTRLKTVTELPTEGAEAGLIRLYVGNSGNGLLKGHMYQSVETEGQISWTDITPVAAAPLAVKGTISAEDLKALDLKNIEPGWMYNISDDFETDDSFVNEGVFEKAGSNVYCIEVEQGEGDNKTTVKKWDVFAVFVTDQQYNPESTNAQSGAAVAEALDAVIKAADEGLDEKLDKRYEMPESASHGFVTAYVGKTNEQFKEGHIYKYEVTEISEETITEANTVINGAYVISVNGNIYYISRGDTAYVYDKSNKTWGEPKTLSGDMPASFSPNCVWTDGNNIYYSVNYTTYLLNKESFTWSIVDNHSANAPATGAWIFNYGENVFAFSGYTMLSFDKHNKIWNKIGTVGFQTGISGRPYQGTWSDGENLYWSYSNSQYVFDKKTYTWNPVTWNISNINGMYIWNYDNNTYLSTGSNAEYVLNKYTHTWDKLKFSSNIVIDGAAIWSDGENVHYSNGSNKRVIHVNNAYRDLTADSDPTDAIPDSDIMGLFD